MELTLTIAFSLILAFLLVPLAFATCWLFVGRTYGETLAEMAKSFGLKQFVCLAILSAGCMMPTGHLVAKKVLGTDKKVIEIRIRAEEGTKSETAQPKCKCDCDCEACRNCRGGEEHRDAIAK